MNNTNNTFAINLFGLLSPEETTVFSPISVRTALHMVYMGSANATAVDLRKALVLFPGERPWVPSRFRHLRLDVANCVWVKDPDPTLSTYRETLLREFGADVGVLPKEASSAAAVVNDWVAEKTGGKIPQIADASSFQGVGIVLTNAIYFRGEWENPFPRHYTAPRVFHGSAKDSTVPFMDGTMKVGIHQDSTMTVVSIPFRDYEAFLTIIMPSNVGDIPKALGWLDTPLRVQEVAVVLPKIRLDGSAELTGPLTEMGAGILFQPAANLSGMTGDLSCRVSSVLHRAVLELDEDGATAAAATAVLITRGIPIMDPPKVVVDRPFVFALVDEVGTILFAGRVTDL